MFKRTSLFRPAIPQIQEKAVVRFGIISSNSNTLVLQRTMRARNECRDSSSRSDILQLSIHLWGHCPWQSAEEEKTADVEAYSSSLCRRMRPTWTANMRHLGDV